MMFGPSHKYRPLHDKARKYLPVEYRKLINTFTYLCNNRIPAIKREIKLTAFLCKTPARMYFMMQYSFNREIGNHILRGGVYNFRQGLSKLGISYVLRSAQSR